MSISITYISFKELIDKYQDNTDILTKIIDFRISKKLDKLEQSAGRHHTDISFCENLVDEINSKIDSSYLRTI